MPAVDEGVSGPPPPGCEGVLGPLDISGCGVVEPGILKIDDKISTGFEKIIVKMK